MLCLFPFQTNYTNFQKTFEFDLHQNIDSIHTFLLETKMKKSIIPKIVFLFLAVVGFLVLFQTKSEAATKNARIIKNGSDNVSGREILKLINKERRKKGLSELQWSDDLEKLARSYSKKMADGKFFSHYEKNGDSVAQRAAAMKIKGWRKIGENLFMSEFYDKLNSFAVENWMKSPSHRQNILDQAFNTTGIGIAQSRDGTIYITQVFTQN